MSFRNYRLQNTCFCKCLKSHVYVHSRRVNMLKRPKYCWNLHDGSFISFLNHSWKISVEKFCLTNISNLNTDQKYIPGNRENLPQAIQTQWSKKLKIFYKHFTAFLKPTFNIKQFEKKYVSNGLYLFEIICPETRAYVNV